MGRTTGRSAEDTRQLVLDAAARVISKRGIATSLDVIARQAGVSKGGLVYHFDSKEALLLALATQHLDGFRAHVLAHVDPHEPEPGRLTRAYVRANLVAEEDRAARERFALLAQLISVPAVIDLATADEDRWARDLAADGVPHPVRTLVVAAADGISTSALWASTVEPETRDRLRADLLAMIDAAIAGA